MAVAPSPRAAPGSLETVRRFLNSAELEAGTDELAAPDRAQAWLSDHGLADADTVLPDRQLRRLRTFRESLRALALANNGAPLDRVALDELNAQASAARLGLAFTAGQQVSLVPAGSGADRVIATLLSIVAEAIGDGTWPRLKACQNSTCRWAFYDHSRNRSGHWCSMADCGNRAKTRAYRRRRRG